MNRTQVDSIKRATTKYAEDLLRTYNNGEPETPVSQAEVKRLVECAYVSGVLSTSQALAMNDGVSISKFVEAARIAGEEITGSKSAPQE